MPPTGSPTGTFTFSTNELVSANPFAIDQTSMTDILRATSANISSVNISSQSLLAFNLTEYSFSIRALFEIPVGARL